MKKALLVFFIFTLVFSCEMPSDQPDDPSEQPDDFNGSASTSNFVYRFIPVASPPTDF